MKLQHKNVESLTGNIMVVALVIISMAFTFVGCVKPAATSSFAEKRQKRAESRVENQQNMALLGSEDEIGLPPKKYTDLARKYSARYHLDWPLVLAVMKQESRFDQGAVSHTGAYGLMQIMPITQLELVDKLGVSDAATPRNNIRAGVYHLRSMFRAFPKASGQDRIELALAAYNAGLTRIMAARQIARYLGENPNRWDAVKNTLPLLSHSFYTLHREIWHENKPPCGYFSGYRQTRTYVENIMQYYDDYSLALK